MTVPSITGVELGGSRDLPLLVCGPSLGTSAAALWSTAAEHLTDSFHVVGWELPGHGRSRARATEDFTTRELAEGVLALVERVLEERGEPGGTFVYAGCSLGGAVGQQLLLDHPGRVTSAVLACTAAVIGEPDDWRGRALQVTRSGTPVLVEQSARTWFRPGFVSEAPALAAGLLHSLQDADARSYAAACSALASFDARNQLARIDVPVVVLAGAYDLAVPMAAAAALAHGIRDSRLVVLEHVGHQAPVEAPSETAQAIRQVAGLGPAHAATVAARQATGMAVRRAVLGEEHVERATAGASDLSRDFQDFITDYAWGGVWTRPGLDRRTRSIITLTALVALGHGEELALHLVAARRNGLSEDEITEVLLQCAIYCGVPAANAAFRVAEEVLARRSTPLHA